MALGDKTVENIEGRMERVLKTLSSTRLSDIPGKALQLWIPHPWMKRAPRSFTTISETVRRVISSNHFDRLWEISQVGSHLLLLSQGRMTPFTVAQHTWTVYDLMHNFILNSGLEPEQAEACRIAAVVHDILKPPWTPISEVFMVKSHEDLLSEFESLRKICEPSASWREITDAVKGKGRFGRLFESEADLDKVGYVAFMSDLLALTAYESQLTPMRFGMREALKLVSHYRIVYRDGVFHLCMEPNPEHIKLFGMFMEELINQYAMFLEPHLAVFQALAFRVLEEAIETHVVPLNWFTSIENLQYATDRDITTCLDKMGQRDDTDHLRKLWRDLKGRNVWHYAALQVGYADALDGFIRKTRRLREEMKTNGTPYLKSGYRRFMSDLETWVARESGARREDIKDFVILFHERIQPDFARAYDVEEFDWQVKKLLDGLELVSSDPEIKPLKEQERDRLCRLVCVLPSKYYRKASEIDWKDISRSF
jgi:hypothetical protein